MKTGIIQAMCGAALLSSFTYIPILARDTLGADEYFITLLVGGYASASFISSYIFGRAGDIYGRRLILRLGLLVGVISFFLLLFSSTLEILLIVRVMTGFAMGMYPGALAAYAYESDMKMGRFASFGAAGWGIGTLCAGYFATFNVYYAFLVAALFVAIGFATSLTLPPIPRVEMSIPFFPIETIKRNLSVYLAVFIRHSSASAVWTFWPLFLADLGGDAFMIAIVQATNSVAQVIVMISITDRFGCRRLVAAGLIASSLTFLWFSLATNILDVIPAQLMLGIAWACLYVGSLKFVTENNVERSTASGLLQSVHAISMVIGPIIAATIFAIWGSYIPIILNAMVMALVGLVVFGYLSRPSRLGLSEPEGCGPD